jgi:thymidine kinase
MTPKEKAEELLLRYLKVKTHKMFNGWWHKITAKQCALIAVDEAIEFENRIIKEVQFLSDKAGHAFRCEGLYWEQVKNEIKKL